MTKELFTRYMEDMADLTYRHGLYGYDEACEKAPDTFIAELNKHDFWSNGDRDDGRTGHFNGAHTTYEMADDYEILDENLWDDKGEFTEKNSPLEEKEAKEYFEIRDKEERAYFKLDDESEAAPND